MIPRDLPTDLISLDVAEQVSERTRATLRRWMSSGLLQRYEGDKPARGGSHIALVSRGELLQVLVAKHQQPTSTRGIIDPPIIPVDDHPRLLLSDDDHPIIPVNDPLPPGADQPPGAEFQEAMKALVDVEAELAAARAEVKRVTLVGEIAVVRVELEAERRITTQLRQDIAAVRLDVEDWKGRHDARVAELEALRATTGSPWWRRLLPG